MAQSISLSVIAKEHNLIRFSADWMNDPHPHQSQLVFQLNTGTGIVPLSDLTCDSDSSGLAGTSTQFVRSPVLKSQDISTSYEKPEDINQLPYKALPGLNMAVNMATLTTQERRFFITLAPTQLQDPCALMQRVVDEGRVMTCSMDNGKTQRFSARPQCVRDPDVYSARPSLSFSNEATWSNCTSSPPSPSPSQQLYADGEFVLETTHPTLEPSQPSEECICPTMLLRWYD